MAFLKQVAQNKRLVKPVIYGLSGVKLTDDEKRFFSQNTPLGFILFARNIVDKVQVKALTDSLRELVDGEVLILIDQEGGRVARMRPPHWKCYPSGEFFAKMYQQGDREAALAAIYDNFVEIAADLVEVGINVDCAPVLDLLCEETHQVIGDRAYGSDFKQVAELGRKVCEGLLSKDVYPVVKHIPGHGRAMCDSHLELPKVDVDLQSLKGYDFEPFKALNDQKFAMTAHVLYSAIDKDSCATISPKAISLIREEIGFKNILMSDDLSMKALGGGFSDRAQAVIEAGCDLVLHCNGEMSEMLEIDSVLPQINDDLRLKLIK